MRLRLRVKRAVHGCRAVVAGHSTPSDPAQIHLSLPKLAGVSRAMNRVNWRDCTFGASRVSGHRRVEPMLDRCL